MKIMRHFSLYVLVCFCMSTLCMDAWTDEAKKILRTQYDQAELLESPAYTMASHDEQVKMLEDFFHKKQKETFDALGSLIKGRECTFDWSQLSPLVGATVYYKLTQRFGLGDLGQIGNVLGIASLVQPTTNAITSFGTTGYNCARSLIGPYLNVVAPYVNSVSDAYLFGYGKRLFAYESLLDGTVAVYKKFDEQNRAYIRLRPHIKTRLRKRIEDYFINFLEYECRKIEDDKAYKQNNNKQSNDDQKEEREKSGIDLILDIILNLPSKSKALEFDPVRIKNAFFGYKPDVIKALQHYCVQQVAASRSSSVQKEVAYFYGPPGTGKTRAVQCVAQALQLPFEIVSLTNLDRDDIVGTEEKPGLLLDVLTRQGRHGKESFSNLVLLFDDADRVLNEHNRATGFILYLMDPETKVFHSPFLDMDIDISHLCIILTGNSEIKDEALRSRLAITPFYAYEAGYKKQVAWTVFIPQFIKVHAASGLPLSLEDVLQFKSLIDQSIEADKDPGFRNVIRIVKNNLEDIVLKKYFPDSVVEVDSSIPKTTVSQNATRTAP